MASGRYVLYSYERNLRTTPIKESAAPRTMASEARVMMGTGEDSMIICNADLIRLVRVVR